mmetsp:Transcript_115000/g.330329  ORF Transcript_115000/g.330329 Transcript_115000/m.330329 type:complete len:218 (-) Transcript_115000:602-1255(-)
MCNWDATCSKIPFSNFERPMKSPTACTTASEGGPRADCKGAGASSAAASAACSALVSVTPGSLNQLWPRHCCAVGLIRSSQFSMRWQMARPPFETWLSKDQFGPARCIRSHSCALLRLLHWKGMSPANSSNKTTPKLQTSATGPKLPRQTSGAMCVGVPATTVQRARRPRRAAKISAMPRSMITACGCDCGSFTFTAWSNKMFSLFRSLWMIPWECT